MKVIICIGCAGAGKSTFVGKYSAWLQTRGKKVYVLNLDPAVTNLIYTPDLDIRDNVSYEQVMEDYNLGPNGAIATSMNLFASKIDEICCLLSSKNEYDVILIDTPGQIEIFTWSSAGIVLFKGLQKTFRDTLSVMYLIDGKSVHDSPFAFVMSILHACSVMNDTLKGKIIFNKMDLLSPQEQKFLQDSIISEEALSDQTQHMEYSGDLLRSLNDRLRDIWKFLPYVGVSSKTNLGFNVL